MRTLPHRFYRDEMRVSYIRSLFVSALSIGAIVSPACAFDEEGCSQLVRACLSRPAESRDVCFESASVSPLCVGSQAGEIAAQRSHFAPMAPKEEEGPAFLGPEVIDRGCLESFDRQLGAMLELGPLNSDGRRILSSQLNRCTQIAPQDLFRP
jgi:hypothetical protein